MVLHSCRYPLVDAPLFSILAGCRIACWIPMDRTITKTNDDKALFSRSLDGQSARRNTADGCPEARPQGARPMRRLGVALLDKG